MPAMNDGIEFVIDSSLSKIDRGISVNLKDSLVTISKSVFNLATGNLAGMVTDAIEGLKSMSIVGELSVESLTWMLIRRSFTRSLLELIREMEPAWLSGRTQVDEAAELNFYEELENATQGLKVAVKSDFFQKPAELPFLKQIQPWIRSWLIWNGVGDRAVDASIRKMGAYFAYALNNEWRSNSAQYALVEQSLSTPFAAADQRARGWREHYAWLLKNVHEPMFAEHFSLYDIYVSPRAFVRIQDPSKRHETLPSSEEKAADVMEVMDLHDELNRWISAGDKDDAIRVISGGPGCGKSSLTRMLAMELSVNETHVLRIPLHLYNPDGDIETQVGIFVSDQGILHDNPLDRRVGPARIILIFDGLDELAMQGREAAETVQKFVHAMHRFVMSRNQTELRVQVVLSGRELIIQNLQGDFRKPRQVYHVMPYYTTPDDRRLYHDPNQLLSQDLRHIWWKAFGRVTQLDFPGLPSDLERSDLIEITSQPLLNYLVATSYIRKTLEFSKEVTINRIYKDLISAVYARSYSGGGWAGTGIVPLDGFMRVLEEIGVACWHGEKRTATVGEIEKQCNLGGLDTVLRSLQEGAKAGVSRLLMAFYFRQNSYREDQQTFEFTHKSFGEFLAGCRVVRSIKRIYDERMRNEELHDGGWTISDAIVRWADLCGRAPMDLDMYRFVISEIQSMAVDDAQNCQSILSELLSFSVRIGVPVDKLTEKPYGAIAHARMVRNVEESLLACHYGLAQRCGKVLRIEGGPLVAGELFCRLRGQRSGPQNRLGQRCMGMLDLSGSIFHLNDFYQCDLSGSILDGCKLNYANLMMANLSRTNCLETNFSGANMYNVIFREARLKGAFFIDASITGADFADAHLEDVNFNGATVDFNIREQRINFKGATLINVKIPERLIKCAIFDPGFDLSAIRDTSGDRTEGHRARKPR